jgi:catabolite regulation protein CreA
MIDNQIELFYKRARLRARMVAAVLALALLASALIQPQAKGLGLALRAQLGQRGAFLRTAAGVAVGALVAPLAAPPAHAETIGETIGEIATSGLIFKDKLMIERFDDPKVTGVKLYVAYYERPLNERLAKNFFSDPTQASVSCVRTGTVTLAEDVSTSKEGEEVFSQSRSLFFKSVKVRRIYDKDSNTLVYVSYSSRLDKGDDENKSRYKVRFAGRVRVGACARWSRRAARWLTLACAPSPQPWAERSRQFARCPSDESDSRCLKFHNRSVLYRGSRLAGCPGGKPGARCVKEQSGTVARPASSSSLQR